MAHLHEIINWADIAGGRTSCPPSARCCRGALHALSEGGHTGPPLPIYFGRRSFWRTADERDGIALNPKTTFVPSWLMLANELQHVAVKGLGLLPVDRVRGLGQHDELGAGNTGELAAHDPGRRLQILISRHQ
jgi:hypothetical protein